MDTIAALATAPGRAAIGVVRVSGTGVRSIVETVLGGPLEPRRATLRWLTHPETDERVDRVLATFFPEPRSYTGEDMLEVSGHGGPLAPQRVLDAIEAAGARPALPGEFTRRAYLNGKLDLLQAEAILDLVDGRSPALHRTAIHQLERGLSARIEALRESILNCQALLVYEIDFPEEDEGPIDPERVGVAAREIVARIDRLLETAGTGELLREGALTVIAGRPNAGKSSLFNVLCGAERAIVTEEPGTTRDAVEALVSLDEFPFRLVDTAGLREDAGRVERMGIEVARRYLASANLVLFCAEAGRPLDDDERRFLSEFEPERTFLIRTKIDRLTESAATTAGYDGEGLGVSVVTGAGLAALRERLVDAAFAGLAAGTPSESPLVTRERHVRQLRQAREEVGAFLDARDGAVAPEVAATHLRAAAQALEELLGVIGPDDLLARVFSEFCIGK